MIRSPRKASRPIPGRPSPPTPALQVSGSSNRVAAVWYSSTSFTVDVNLTDGQAHDLELYFLDWDSKGRSEQVQLSDAASGQVLNTETIASFTSGVYLDWKVSGNLLITITRWAGANAVLNGLFLDPTASGTASIGAAASDRLGVRSVSPASTGGVPAVVMNPLAVARDVGVAASPGAPLAVAAAPATQAESVNSSGKAASGVSVWATARGRRPNGKLLRAAARQDRLITVPASSHRSEGDSAR